MDPERWPDADPDFSYEDPEQWHPEEVIVTAHEALQNLVAQFGIYKRVVLQLGRGINKAFYGAIIDEMYASRTEPENKTLHNGRRVPVTRRGTGPVRDPFKNHGFTKR